jgi:hypothetical protein
MKLESLEELSSRDLPPLADVPRYSWIHQITDDIEPKSDIT